MLEIAEIKPGDILYDLGAGEGRIIIMAAKNFKARAFGFELSPLSLLLAQIKILFSGTSGQAKLICRNFYNQKLSKADVITCFLRPKPMEKLKGKFKKELKPGTRIVSYAFSIPGWKPEKVVKVNEKTSPIFLYEIKK
jgi:ribosomal protein L11 methylase PrmA